MKLDLQQSSSETDHVLSQSLIDKTFTDGCPRRSATDFTFSRTLGEGAYSSVFRCMENESTAEFAIKVIQKSHVLRHQKMDAIIREKNILQYLTQTCLSHPFICQLYTSFHDNDQIYFVMGLVEGGDLSESLSHFGSFDVPTTRFFASEILTGLRFLHEHKIVHRDMKPENILIKTDGHIVIADLGSAQAMNELVLSREGFTVDNQANNNKLALSPPLTHRNYSDDEEENGTRRTTFVGTALYLSPEMLADGDIGAQTDIWGLGCIIFQCLAGQPPFRAVNQYHMLRKIKELDYSFPEGFPNGGRELLKQILVADPSVRLNSDNLMVHPFFKGVDWENITINIPPILHAYIPATFGEPEFYSNIENSEPTIDDRALMRLIRLDRESSGSFPATPTNAEVNGENFAPEIAPRTESQAERLRAEREDKLEKQRTTNIFHIFTNNLLILKQGYLEKKRGLFARRRMFLLTEGPHLLYIDVPNMVLKGEVPWTPCMQVEVKTFGTFFIHTPNRVYYLFDAEKKSEEWCKAIENVRVRYAKIIQQTYENAMRDGTFGNIYGKKKSRKEMMREQKAIRRKQEKEQKKALKAMQTAQKSP
ncbi:unnamed protein product [Caenorhabditis sp. 36 PRJEB53466]|nr:unnamed protein product [Caenorhabditis sp. 36 PRJEB53466]